VLEVTEFSQLEFSFSVMDLSLVSAISRRRRGGNVEIRCLWFLPDFQARWKEWKTRFWFWSFPRFPRGVISTALFLSPFSERSDAEVAFIAAEFLSPWAPFFAFGQNPKLACENLAPGWLRNDDLTIP
jgi:hypothetical protein